MKYETPGHAIQVKLKDKGISAYRLALLVDMHPQNIYGFVNNKRNITPNIAKKLSKELGETEIRWLRLQAEYDLSLMQE